MTGPATAGADVAVFLDPPTHHQLQNRLFDRASSQHLGDDLLAPFVAVRDRLTEMGFPVQTADFLPHTPGPRRNIIVSFGMPDRLVSQSVRRYEALHRRDDVILSAFVALECPVVEPGLYRSLPTLQPWFRRILSWSDSRSLLPFTGTRVEVQHFFWPQSFDAVHEALWSRTSRRFLVMMNTNKLPRLFVNELYTARLQAVEYFHRFGEIDLYGRYWDRMPVRVGKSPVPVILRRLAEQAWRVKQALRPNVLYAAAASAARGSVASKSETLAEYRFALCFENSILKGWMTEKLFDCFFAGTVPVYWGAPDVLEWVPADCFIDMRQFKDFAELRAFLHALSDLDVQRYREAARAYLASDRFTPFRIGTFSSLIAGIVAADAGVGS